jgi:lysophospholipase L1-like esterase
MRSGIRALAVNGLLFLTTLVISALLGEGALRVFHLYPPVRYHLLPPHAKLHDVQTSWDVVYETNALGLRGDEVAVSKPPGVFRLALVGDSFTFGMGCAREDTLSEILERRFHAEGRPIEVLSVSNFSINPNAYFDLVRELALPLGADLVVVTVCGNDASAIHEPSATRRLVRSIGAHSHLVTLLRIFRRTLALSQPSPLATAEARASGALPGDVDGVRARALAEFQRTHGPRFNNLVAGMVTDPDEVARWLTPPDGNVGWREFESSIGGIQDLCRAKNVPLIVGIVPDGAAVDPRQGAVRREFGISVPDDVLTAPFKFESLVSAFASRRGIPCLDPIARFRSVRDGLYFDADIHWTPAGNALYADELARFLEPWLPPSPASAPSTARP